LSDVPDALAFYLLAGLTALGALGCAVTVNIVRMALCLLLTLTGVALLYFLMAANFLGVIQLVVYAGGTLIVIVFGVMLTSRAYGPKLRVRGWETLLATVVGLALFGGLTTLLLRAAWPAPQAAAAAPTVAQLGDALLSTYLVPFEVASVLLLAVMIGAAYLTQPDARK
jgi:NADH-quinone oxidoreductase subunit J